GCLGDRFLPFRESLDRRLGELQRAPASDPQGQSALFLSCDGRSCRGRLRQQAWSAGLPFSLILQGILDALDEEDRRHQWLAPFSSARSGRKRLLVEGIRTLLAEFG